MKSFAGTVQRAVSDVKRQTRHRRGGPRQPGKLTDRVAYGWFG